jgi:hypothetical protein
VVVVVCWEVGEGFMWCVVCVLLLCFHKSPTRLKKRQLYTTTEKNALIFLDRLKPTSCQLTKASTEKTLLDFLGPTTTSPHNTPDIPEAQPPLLHHHHEALSFFFDLCHHPPVTLWCKFAINKFVDDPVGKGAGKF